MNKRDFIFQDLLSRIYRQTYRDGKLPTQRELAREYGVSRYTIQAALDALEDIGAIHTVQGSGVYVNRTLRVNPLVFNSLTRTPYERIESRMIDLSRALATSDEQQMFSLKSDDEVWHFRRLRIVNHEVEQLESTSMPYGLFPDLSKEIIEWSIQGYVERLGYRISHNLTTYHPVSVSREDAEYLLCKPRTPAMYIINRGVLTDGRVFEYSENVALDYQVTYIRPFDREIHAARLAHDEPAKTAKGTRHDERNRHTGH